MSRTLIFVSRGSSAGQQALLDNNASDHSAARNQNNFDPSDPYHFYHRLSSQTEEVVTSDLDTEDPGHRPNTPAPVTVSSCTDQDIQSTASTRSLPTGHTTHKQVTSVGTTQLVGKDTDNHYTTQSTQDNHENYRTQSSRHRSVIQGTKDKDMMMEEENLPVKSTGPRHKLADYIDDCKFTRIQHSFLLHFRCSMQYRQGNIMILIIDILYNAFPSILFKSAL